MAIVYFAETFVSSQRLPDLSKNVGKLELSLAPDPEGDGRSAGQRNSGLGDTGLGWLAVAANPGRQAISHAPRFGSDPLPNVHRGRESFAAAEDCVRLTHVFTEPVWTSESGKRDVARSCDKLREASRNRPSTETAERMVFQEGPANRGDSAIITGLVGKRVERYGNATRKRARRWFRETSLT